MLAPNIETEVREILEKKGKAGWLRVSQCAKLYANGNASKETKFYRWRKQVEKGKVKGFQVMVLPGNISFIGLETADPRAIETFISEDKKLKRLDPYPHFFWQTVSEIKNLLAQKENWQAWTKTLVLIETFPLKDKMQTDIDQAIRRIGLTHKIEAADFYMRQLKRNRYFNTTSKQEILNLIGKMSTLLHES